MDHLNRTNMDEAVDLEAFDFKVLQLEVSL